MIDETTEGETNETGKMPATVKKALEEIVDYAKKVNENMIAVNEQGTDIVHSTHGRRGMYNRIEEFLARPDWRGSEFEEKALIKGYLDVILENNTVGGPAGYTRETVESTIAKLEPYQE